MIMSSWVQTRFGYFIDVLTSCLVKTEIIPMKKRLGTDPIKIFQAF